MSKGEIGLFLALLALFVGCADMLGGYDRYIYCDLFDSLAKNMKEGNSIFSSALFKLYGKEFGYVALNIIIAFITSNRYVFILIITIIIYALVFRSIIKYTNRSPLVIILFMGLWFFFTFTYLRQVLAASIVWIAIEYAIDRKPLQFFATILIAFSVHNSAILFSLIYFIPLRKFNVSFIIGVMAFCLVLGAAGIASNMYGQYGEIVDAERIAAIGNTHETEFRIEYLIEAFVFLTLILQKYNTIDASNKTQVMMCNIAFIFCAILLIFIKSENGGRLSWYFMIGLISTLALLAEKGKGKAITGYSMTLVALSIGLYIRILTSWGILVSPYKTFFTNGHREGDIIYNVYEYDKNYDSDKFYK